MKKCPLSPWKIIKILENELNCTHKMSQPKCPLQTNYLSRSCENGTEVFKLSWHAYCFV